MTKRNRNKYLHGGLMIKRKDSARQKKTYEVITREEAIIKRRYKAYEVIDILNNTADWIEDSDETISHAEDTAQIIEIRLVEDEE